jgi:hypothetical protein
MCSAEIPVFQLKAEVSQTETPVLLNFMVYRDGRLQGFIDKEQVLKCIDEVKQVVKETI